MTCKPGQVMTRWWQQYVKGALRSPQDIFAAARAEAPDKLEDRFTVEPSDNAQWDTPLRLAAPNFVNSDAWARQQFRADWQHVPIPLRLWAARVVLAARRQGVPLYVHSAYRTADEQAELLRKGVTKVGYPRSAHNIGEAVDIVHGTYHWNLTEKEWLWIRHLALDQLRKINAGVPKDRQLRLNWGGDDGTPQDTFRWDPAHWEIADYRERIRRLPSGVPVHSSPTMTVGRYR